jgi:hypothetical protein
MKELLEKTFILASKAEVVALGGNFFRPPQSIIDVRTPLFASANNLSLYQTLLS